MSTTSRRLSQRGKQSRNSHTPGKTKGGNCVRSELKTWGAHANPYKLRGDELKKYDDYCKHIDGINRGG